MKVNYHTHTFRCHHGYGCEWEYVENAIAGGMELLGFADHAPWPFPNGHFSRMRMLPKDLPGYIDEIARLKQRYAGQIEIHCGLEAEYYPALMPAFEEMLEQNPGVEYLILGQHYLMNEFDQPIHTSKPTDDPKMMVQFVDQVLEGLETGRYLYLCHPDVIHFTGDSALYREQMRRLCRGAKALGIPLEINLQGYRAGSHYPARGFWEIAAEEGCTAIIGTDAHRAKNTCDHTEIAVMQSLAAELGLPLIEEDLLK